MNHSDHTQEETYASVALNYCFEVYSNMEVFICQGRLNDKFTCILHKSITFVSLCTTLWILGSELLWFIGERIASKMNEELQVDGIDYDLKAKEIIRAKGFANKGQRCRWWIDGCAAGLKHAGESERIFFSQLVKKQNYN